LEPKDYNNNDGTTFFALNVNPRNGTVELIRHNMKIVHELLDSDDRRAASASGSAESKPTNFGDESEKIIHGGAIIEKK
jgi:hypothetical protein